MLPFDNIESMGIYDNGYKPYTNNEIEIVSTLADGDVSHGYVYNTFDQFNTATFEYNITKSEVEWRGGGHVEMDITPRKFSDNNLVSLVMTVNDFARYTETGKENNKQYIVNINPQKIGVKLVSVGIDNKNSSTGGFDTNLDNFTDDNMYYGYRCILYDRKTNSGVMLKYINGSYAYDLRVDIAIPTENGFRSFSFNDNYAVGFVSDYYNENAWSRADRGAIQTCVIDNTTYMNGIGGTYDIIRETGNTYINRYNLENGDQYKIMFFGKDSYYAGTIYIEYRYTKDTILKMLACFGLYVKIGDIEYMPVITEDRKCTGVLVPPSEQAKTDSLIKDTDNTNPIIIKPDAPIDNDLENIGLNENTGNSKFVRWYALTPTEINALQDWLNSDEREVGYNPMQNIIGVAEYMFDLNEIAYLVGTSNIKIGTETYGGFGTPQVASLITNITRTYNLGSVTINRYNNDFTDFSPYSTYDIYIPYCGWCHIDSDIAVGNTVDVKLIIDPITSSCKGICLVNGNIIAEINGTIGNTIPVSSNNIGQYKQALLSNALSIGSGVVATATGIASGNAVGAVSGGLSLISGVAQNVALKHTSFTESKGNTSTSTMYNTYDRCVLVETHPVEYISTGYAHSIGYVTNETKSISECDGFIVCENVDTSGLSCTETEKQMIKSMLENGCYI